MQEDKNGERLVETKEHFASAMKKAYSIGLSQREHPSLPSDLDEVKLDTSNMTDCGYKAIAEYYFNLGKKAGAEWMAWQGETVVGVIGCVGNRLDCELLEYLPKETDFERGDKVIIQIRKKQ